jgi:hypothetical protein
VMCVVSLSLSVCVSLVPRFAFMGLFMNYFGPATIASR